MTHVGGKEWQAVAAASQGTTRQLAGFISGLRADKVPESTKRIVRKAFVDAIGCGIHGLTMPWARMIHDFSHEQGGPAEATLWASNGAKISCMNAALASGTAVHSFDFDDHARAKIHLGAVVIPAALALGERENISGERLMTAIAAGYETMIRVSLAANPNSSRMRGWHLTGTTGTFAAAAAASVILGFDAETTASALGMAGTQSSGLWAFNSDGAMSKRFHPGRAAQSGLMAALLAQRGYHGPRFILEAPDGGFLQATSDDVRIEEITRGLGTEWRAEDTCFKPYACCGSNHSSIDAALDILRENNLKAGDVARVLIGVSKVVDTQTGFPYRQTTVLNAQMSIRYDVAVAMLDGQAYLEQFTEARLKDPALNELISRVDVQIDAEMDAVYPRLYAGKVTVETRDGRKITKRVDYSRGMPENPMDEAEVKGKFLSLAGAAAGRATAESLLRDVEAAAAAASIRPLAHALGAVRITG